MTSYFEYFNKSMKETMRIPVSLVEKHYNEIFFLVDVDYTFVQAATPRVRLLRPLGYEINVDESSAAIKTLLSEEVDKTANFFGNYEMVKSKITMELKIASAIKKKDRIVKKLKAKFGEGAEEEEEEEEEDEEEEETQTQDSLALTQGMGEDEEEEEIEGAKGEEAEEASTPPEPNKRKAKV